MNDLNNMKNKNEKLLSKYMIYRVMSLDTETKNIPNTINFRPITGGYIDQDKFGITESGDVIYVTNRNTWAEIFEHGLLLSLSPVIFIQQEPKNITGERESSYTKMSHPTRPYMSANFLQRVETHCRKLFPKYYTKPKKTKEKSNKLRAKTKRSRKFKVEKPQKNIFYAQNQQDQQDQQDTKEELVNKCFTEWSVDTCSICKDSAHTVMHYKSVFTKNGSYMCDECSRFECCPGCGWDTGGSVCRTCLSEY